MGIISTQGFQFKLVANGTQLDTFDDEPIMLSDNVTGLFDLGLLPADFTRQITLPGTKVNNAFFEHVYDISIDSPFLFATNQKVSAYFDFDGLYLAQGYLQLNKVNVIANKFIDSYEVTIYGMISSFAREVNRAFLTDLTSSLSKFNHTASLSAISSSWNYELFSGSIIYPFAEYGQEIRFTPEEAFFGIDSSEGALTVQDYKPAIRIKEVWDAIFETYGYTYTGSFWQEEWLDNVYMICNNKLRYPVFSEYDLETYGLFRIAPISGSGTDVPLNPATPTELPWYNIQSNPSNNINQNLEYTLDFTTRIRGEIALNFEVTSTGAGNGIPVWYFIVEDLSNNIVSTTALVNFNSYMTEVQTYNATQTRTQKFRLVTEFNTATLDPGTYKFYIQYDNQGGSNFSVTLNPDASLEGTYLQITKVNQGGDGLVMDIASNMPFGTTGIKQIDFITGLQKKFNLVIYPSKVKAREFIVETFNNWYKSGQIKSFDRYINLNDKIEFVPANNLAVNKLNFGDRLDGDYVSQQFAKENNREYGKSYYVDTENFFSQGTFEVQTTLASSPLIYLAGTGLSGSAQTGKIAQFRASATINEANVPDLRDTARASIAHYSLYVVQAIAEVTDGGFAQVCDPTCSTLKPRVVKVGDPLYFIVSTTTPTGTYSINKVTDSGTTTLASGTGFYYNTSYTLTQADIDSSVLQFYVEMIGT